MALTVSAITFRCLYINPVLAQGTDGTGCSISRVHEAGMWARGERHMEGAQEILEEPLFLDTHACEYQD